MPLMVKWMAATSPGLIVPFTVVIAFGVTHFSQVIVMSSSSMPAACAIIGTVAPQDMTRMSGFSSSAWNSGRLPDPHLDLVVALVVQVVEDLERAHDPHLGAEAP